MASWLFQDQFIPERSRVVKAICYPDYRTRLELVRSTGWERGDGPPTPLSFQDCVGYYPAPFVRFSGGVIDIVRNFTRGVFGISLRNPVDVYLDEDFNAIELGVHEIEVYGIGCLLYKAEVKGAKRGLIVMKGPWVGGLVRKFLFFKFKWVEFCR